MTYWIVFTTVYLHSYLLITDNARILKLIECPYAFLIKTSKVLMRFSVNYLRFTVSKCSYYVLFCMKYSYLLTEKITPDVNNNLYMPFKSCAVLCMLDATFDV